jgi:putative flippase GtrA
MSLADVDRRRRSLEAILRLSRSDNRRRVVRWFVAGLAFMGLSTAFLYLFVDVAGMPVPVGTLATAEVCTLLRFAVNHYWVFGARNPTWRQCMQYHVANAGAFSVWWIAANVLALLGVHYLIAGILAVGFSTFFSLFANFFWVWRDEHHTKKAP